MRFMHGPVLLHSGFYYDRQGVLLQVQSTNMFEGLKYLREEGTRGSRRGVRKRCVAMKGTGCVGRMVLESKCWRVAVWHTQCWVEAYCLLSTIMSASKWCVLIVRMESENQVWEYTSLVALLVYQDCQ